MKIGIACYPSVGGSGIVATRLGQQLAQRGHEVHFITYDPPFELRLDQPGVFFHQVAINNYDLFKYPDYALTLAVKIAQVTKEADLDVVHVHYAIPHATSAYLARQLLGGGPAIVTTLHGTDITLIGQEVSFREMVCFSINQSDVVTAVSDSLRQETLSTFTLQRDVKVIPNFIAPPQVAATRPPFLPADYKVITHISNFRPVKRPQTAMRIFATLRARLAAKLLLIGDGPEMAATHQLAEKLGLKEDVIFMGASQDVGDYLTHSDLFLLPSEHEAFGLSALEAMAHGVPVIASNVGGLPEVIAEGKTGYLLPVDDVSGMAAMALQLLSNPQQQRQMSETARQHTLERFHPDLIVPQYEQCYEAALTSGFF